MIGDDKFGHRLIGRMPSDWPGAIVLDRSSSFGRAVRLIRRGVLSWQVCFRMAWADFWRRDIKVPPFPAIMSNQQLQCLIEQLDVRTVFLFRAGLIINRSILDMGVELLNTHCARIPAYGGLGSIARALADGAHNQCATLHRVTERIDAGEVIDTEPYCLRSDWSYGRNEDVAYDAGIDVLLRNLTRVLRRAA